ncbi:hypothetical protein EBZ39_16515 [bacterium]|nr:hypothetical protein [bacterium]
MHHPLFAQSYLLLKSYEHLVEHISMFYLQLAFLTLWIVLFVYVRKLFRQKKRFLIGLLFTALASTGLTLAFKYAIQQRVYLITKRDGIPVYSGPGRNFTVLEHLPASEELVKLRTVGDFTKARWRGSVVWIANDDVYDGQKTDS